MVGRIIGGVFLFIVALAIYKMNNGNVAQIVHSVWALLNKGADFVTSIFKKFLSMQSSSSSGSKSGSSTAMILNWLYS